MNRQEQIDQLIRQKKILETVNKIDKKNSQQNQIDKLVDEIKLNKVKDSTKKQSNIDSLVEEIKKK